MHVQTCIAIIQNDTVVLNDCEWSQSVTERLGVSPMFIILCGQRVCKTRSREVAQIMFRHLVAQRVEDVTVVDRQTRTIVAKSRWTSRIERRDLNEDDAEAIILYAKGRI